MRPYEQMRLAATQVLKEQKYRSILAWFSVGFLALFIFIPVVTTPGNDLAYQLSIFRVRDYALMIFLAVLVGLNFSMSLYARRVKKDAHTSVTGDTAVGLGGIFAAIVGTGSCVACLASLFAYVGLGVGAAAFVLEYQVYFLLVAIGLMLVLLSSTAKRVNKTCKSC